MVDFRLKIKQTNENPKTITFMYCVRISREKIKLVLKISLAYINDLALPLEAIFQVQTLSNSRGQE